MLLEASSEEILSDDPLLESHPYADGTCPLLLTEGGPRSPSHSACTDQTRTAPAQSFQRGKAAFKKLGVGLGALVSPGKGRKSSTVLTIATPPVVVAHWQSKGEWTSVRP